MGNVLRSSGFITPDTEFPFVTIQKIVTVGTGSDSCNALEEESIFEFHIFGTRRKDVTRIQEKIKTQFDYSTLYIKNRNFLGVFADGGTIREPQPSLFQGVVRYRIMAERLFKESLNLQVTSGANLFECIYNRYLNSTKLKHRLNHFTTSSFAVETAQLPYCTIRDFDTEIDSWNTQGYLEDTHFTFQLRDTSAQSVEEIKEILFDEFHFATFNIAERIFCKLGYVSDTLIEEISGLWLGEVEYSLIDMKEL